MLTLNWFKSSLLIVSACYSLRPALATPIAMSDKLAHYSMNAQHPKTSRYLFGGDRPWNESEWASQDDRLRGGSSQSYLSTICSGSAAVFHGTLDTTTLGGAGFASQRTKGFQDHEHPVAGLPWDLSCFDGLRISLASRADDGDDVCDDKTYVVTLMDEVPPRLPNGMEDSGVSWEATFSCASVLAGGNGRNEGTVDVVIPWNKFVPTYRGRPKNDAKPLDLQSIKRLSLMMRSFFNSQSGDFKLTVQSIAAIGIHDSRLSFDSDTTASKADSETFTTDKPHNAAPVRREKANRVKLWSSWMCCGL